MKKPILNLLSVILTLPQAYAGIIEPATLWEKNEIVTCFYNSEAQLAPTKLKTVQGAKETYEFVPKELSRREKKKVAETVLKNFSAERTGIYFTGWKDCSDTEEYDLIVMEAKGLVPFITRPSFNGRAVIGEDGSLARNEEGAIGFYEKSGAMPYVALTVQKAGTVVHEFGHVAGLRHEHIHQDAFADENCSHPFLPLDFTKPETIEKPHDSTLIYTSYDPQSIMNYCWMIPRRSQLDREKGVILSQKDIETLSQFYK